MKKLFWGFTLLLLILAACRTEKAEEGIISPVVSTVAATTAPVADEASSPIQVLTPPPTPHAHLETEVAAWVRENVVMLETAEPGHGCSDLQPFLEMVGDGRVVALGAATRGSHEFATTKHRLLECLVTEKGFNLFLLEANGPQANRINDYVLGGEGDPRQLLSALSYWPWNSEEMVAVIEWIRDHNQTGEGPTVRFRGFDIRLPRQAMAEVLAYLQQVDPGVATTAESRYDCFRPYAKPTLAADYMTLSFTARGNCRDALQQVHDDLVANRETYVALSTAEAFTRALQSARLVRQAEVYYDSDQFAKEPRRERALADNVRWLSEQAGPETKAILWSHNLLIQDAWRAMGEHLRAHFGRDLVTVGFTFYQGTFNALSPEADEQTAVGVTSHTYTAPELVSFAYALHRAGLSRFYLDLRAIAPGTEVTDWLMHRGAFVFYGLIGETYNPGELASSNYPPAFQYDIMFYFDETTPTSLLATP